jgi:predicted MFS family arabinose efflux permease
VPRIVRPDELMAANSATWTGETLADIAGYPLAGLFIAFLGSALPIAFFADAATYLISAALLAAISIPRSPGQVAHTTGNAARRFAGELMDGWRYLRRQPALFQNTVVSAVAQTSIGATLALTVVYSRDWLDQSTFAYPANYAAIETAIGIGNLVGGFAVGAIGGRLRKGPLIVGGMIAMGAGTVVLGLTGDVLIALVGAATLGVANLVFIIPTQTMFGEVVPIHLMGRVVAFRSSLVYGAMMGAMAVSGVLAETMGAGLVIAAFGAVTVAAGLISAVLPAVRDPEHAVELAAARDAPARS